MHKTRLTIVCVWSKLRSTDPWRLSRTDLANVDMLSEVIDGSKPRSNSCSLLRWRLETRCLGSRPHRGITAKLLLCLNFLCGGVCRWFFPRKIFVCLQQKLQCEPCESHSAESSKWAQRNVEQRLGLHFSVYWYRYGDLRSR